MYENLFSEHKKEWFIQKIKSVLLAKEDELLMVSMLKNVILVKDQVKSETLYSVELLIVIHAKDMEIFQIRFAIFVEAKV